MKKVGFAGLGIMGQGMAANLLKKGFGVTVWNRDLTKAEGLVAQGAQKAANMTALVEASEVVITMVRDDAAVRGLLLGEKGAFAGAKAGQTFIDMSTVSPGMARELAAAAQAKGLHYLEAPVFGSKGAAAAGELTILAGGPQDLFDAQHAVLEAMSAKIIPVGQYGAAATLKLANNQLLGVMLAALGESLALTDGAGIDHAFAAEMLIGTVGRVAALKKDKIIKREWSTEFALDMVHKDLTQTLVAANDHSLPMPILAATRETYQRARNAGRGDLDFSAITEKVD